MSDLLAERLKLISPPFLTTGVDLFGPFHLVLRMEREDKGIGGGWGLCLLVLLPEPYI